MTSVDATFEPRDVTSADGTTIRYRTLGTGPGLVVVGGVLSSADAYLPLARLLAEDFRVHVVERRGRPGSGPQRDDHAIADECADLAAVLRGTGARAIFGHSFGGLVALELARDDASAERLVVYEPGVPLRGLLQTGWFEGYEQRLRSGDRRGAFAWMVKENGFAPAALARMPVWWVQGVLRLVVRGERWSAMERLLDANLAEHRAQAALDAPNAARFSSVSASTLVLAGAKSPPAMKEIAHDVASCIPGARERLLPGLDHVAPHRHPEPVAAAVREELI